MSQHLVETSEKMGASMLVLHKRLPEGTASGLAGETGEGFYAVARVPLPDGVRRPTEALGMAFDATSTSGSPWVATVGAQSLVEKARNTAVDDVVVLAMPGRATSAYLVRDEGWSRLPEIPLFDLPEPGNLRRGPFVERASGSPIGIEPPSSTRDAAASSGLEVPSPHPSAGPGDPSPAPSRPVEPAVLIDPPMAIDRAGTGPDERRPGSVDGIRPSRSPSSPEASPAIPGRDAIAALIDGLPGAEHAGTPQHAVPVWVRRADLAALASPGAPSSGASAALAAFVDDVRQPAFAADRQRIPGVFLAGATGVKALLDGFGGERVAHRKLWMSRDALVDRVASKGLGIEFDAVIAASAGYGAAVEAAKAQAIAARRASAPAKAGASRSSVSRGSPKDGPSR